MITKVLEDRNTFAGTETHRPYFPNHTKPKIFPFLKGNSLCPPVSLHAELCTRLRFRPPPFPDLTVATNNDNKSNSIQPAPQEK